MRNYFFVQRSQLTGLPVDLKIAPRKAIGSGECNGFG